MNFFEIGKFMDKGDLKADLDKHCIPRDFKTPNRRKCLETGFSFPASKNMGLQTDVLKNR